MNSCAIRQAVEADVAVLTSHNVAMALETEDLALDPHIVTPGVATILADGSKGRYYCATQGDGVVVGQLMITFEWSDWRNSNVWWIQSVYVQPEHRRRGIFRALYDHVRQEAHRAGAAGLRLYADNSNSCAHATVSLDAQPSYLTMRVITWSAQYKTMGMTSHYTVFEDMFTGY